jgi:hypothetical protein
VTGESVMTAKTNVDRIFRPVSTFTSADRVLVALRFCRPAACRVDASDQSHCHLLAIIFLVWWQHSGPKPPPRGNSFAQPMAPNPRNDIATLMSCPSD